MYGESWMCRVKEVMQWFGDLEGVGYKDKFLIFVAKLLYLVIRFSLRLILGKDRRDRYLQQNKIHYTDFIYSDITVRIDGFIVTTRHHDDDLIFLHTSHEPEVAKVLTSNLKDDDVLIDVGANVGRYVLLASRIIRNGRIIAIEAHPKNYEFLLRNLKQNRVTAECINAAISDQPGTVNLHISTAGSGKHSIREGRIMKGAIQVSSVTLDSIIDEKKIDRIDWILIDVEGAENSVLKGGTKALSLARNIIVEIHYQENRDFVLGFLQQAGFKPLWLDADKIPPHLYAYK